VETLMRRFITKTCCLVFYLAFCLGVNSVSCLAQPRSPKDETQSLFDFHSGFWINLHHFLYLEALSEKPQKGPHPAIVNKADAETLNSLSEEERVTWNAAVSYYASAVIQRDLLFDQNMGVIKNQLEDAEASTDLASADVPAALKAALLKAAPIYRKYWWTRHDAQNRKWIAQLQPLVGKYGEGLKNSLTRIYEAPWPGHPVRVDAAVYAGQFGAYTTDEPTRPTISTADPANQGNAALEIVFHETSHGMMDKVMDAMREAERKVDVSNQPKAFRTGTLWHAVLFYTAGELVAEQIPSYIPYADKNGLWVRAWPDPDRSLIEQDWKPHMTGAVGLQAALTKLVDDLAAAQRQKDASQRR
jgi:hypothetical protein